MNLEWYGVRCIFDHPELESEVEGGHVYEERVVLVRAGSFEDAIQLAEREAEQYCRGIEPCQYIESAQAYLLVDDPTEEGAEVFSLMRSSALAPDDYVDRFFDTGDEHQGSTESGETP